MRNLDEINPPGMRPSRFTTFGAGVSIALATISTPLAYGATPEHPFLANLIVQFLLALIVASILLSFGSIVFKWGWQAKYFGWSMLCIGSVSLLATVPLFSILIFGVLPLWAKGFVFVIYVISHLWWCRKFVVLYCDAFSDKSLREILYEEDKDAVYYKRQGDNFLLREHYKFSQMPPNRYFLIFIFLAFALTPLAGAASLAVGVPFVHVFLAVSMLPVSWMGVGLAVRGYLICYYFPARIRAETGKEIYVDLISDNRAGRPKRMYKNAKNTGWRGPWQIFRSVAVSRL